MSNLQNHLNYILMHVFCPKGIAKVIGYVSRAPSKTEHKYPSHKLKFVALKWAITEQFHEYLYGNTFIVYTDNNPLTYILTSVKLDATGHHWLAKLTNDNFAFRYKSEKANVDVDALFYILWDDYDWHIEADTVQVLIFILMEVYSCNIQVNESSDIQKDPKAILQKDWNIAQSPDPAIREIKFLISKNKGA